MRGDLPRVVLGGLLGSPFIQKKQKLFPFYHYHVYVIITLFRSLVTLLTDKDERIEVRLWEVLLLVRHPHAHKMKKEKNKFYL